MRFSLVPIFIAALLAVGPTTVHALTNQGAAEKIAANLGEQFPGYDIMVKYQNGKVCLAGQVASDEMMRQTLEQVQKIPGIQVSEIENGLRVAPKQDRLMTPAGAVKRETNVSMAPVSVTPNMPVQKDDRCQPVQRNQIASAPVPMPNRQEVQPLNTPPRPDVLQVSAQQQVAKQPMPLQQAPAAKGYANQYPAAAQQPCPCPNHGGMQGAYPQPQPMMQYADQGYPNGMQQGYPAGVQGGMQGYQGAPMMAPPQQAAYGGYAGEPYGPQGPMPGNYNNPNLPDYAWPSYAAYPNYAEVCYPKQYSPKAWPYIGPFYPYPQAPLGWRQVTLEWHDGWWWLDFDDGSPTGPFSPLFRQPVRYTY